MRAFTRRSSSSSQTRHAAISAPFGRSWRRLFPLARHLKCLTAFVTKTRLRSIPASASASSNTRPAGPTNGCPARSSLSPGCSPTKRTFALRGPSPNTVCVARAQRGQPRHSFDASATLRRDRGLSILGYPFSSRTPRPEWCAPLVPSGLCSLLARLLSTHASNALPLELSSHVRILTVTRTTWSGRGHGEARHVDSHSLRVPQHHTPRDALASRS